LKRLRRSILDAAFSGRLTEEFDHGHIEDGWPNGWNLQRVDELFSVRSGGTPSRKIKDYYVRGTIPWVKTAEVQNRDITVVGEYITKRAVEESSAKVFPAGTLLIAMYGEGRTRGQVGRLTFPAATNQACAGLVAEKMAEELRHYVFLFLLSQYHKLRAEAVGGNQPNLNLGTIKGWTIPLPPESERSALVERVESLLEVVNVAQDSYDRARDACKKIPRSILSKAFRGELVPTEAELAELEGRSFESGEELLARISKDNPTSKRQNGRPCR
jgi:type I restriction enzyme S subunit